MSQEVFNDGVVAVNTPTEQHVPGMFLTTPLSEKEKFADLTDEEIQSFAYTEQQLRIGLKSLFNVALAGLYIEENAGKPVTGYTIPFHMDRLRSQFDVSVYQPHIEAYLRSYDGSLSEQDYAAIAMRGLMARGNREETGDEEINENTCHEVEERPPLYEVIDIDDELEIPRPPAGMKYYVCLGGSKNFQAFLTEDSLSKGAFLDMFEDELDEALEPVYEDETLVVRQDAKYAVPGFYIVGTKAHYRTIEEMPQRTFKESLSMASRIKKQLAELGIAESHIYHDEKYQSPASTHFWVVPLHHQSDDQTLNRTIRSADIWTYLDRYARFNETRADIAQYNQHMRELLKK